MRSISKLWQKLRNKAYRDGYMEAQLSIEVPFQIRALRKARGWTQAQLSERCGIPQARISYVEQPGRDPLSLRTLYRLASAFDVGLLVQFVSFSELVRREAEFNPETFCAISFKDDHLGEIVHTSGPIGKTFRVFSSGEGHMEKATSVPEPVAALSFLKSKHPSRVIVWQTQIQAEEKRQTRIFYSVGGSTQPTRPSLRDKFFLTSTTLSGDETLWLQDEPHKTIL